MASKGKVRGQCLRPPLRVVSTSETNKLMGFLPHFSAKTKRYRQEHLITLYMSALLILNKADPVKRQQKIPVSSHI